MAYYPLAPTSRGCPSSRDSPAFYRLLLLSGDIAPCGVSKVECAAATVVFGGGYQQSQSQLVILER